MSLADVTSARSSPSPEVCPDCDTSASVTSDLHKYQVACTCKPPAAQYACAEESGPVRVTRPADTPPALPPRPPTAVRRPNASLGTNAPESAVCGRRRKYAWWCVGCGALAAALGGLLAAAHILLRAYTASPHHLETVPAAVPAAMLVLTGVCIMSLARRRNRYSYMIKVVGACCLVCALTCVLVTITTTVIHMNKLQTLKFCEYTKLTRTCTCFSMPPDTQHALQEEEGVRCVFEGVSDCGVVHGVLYWCLRGVFALSVTAVLVCIFSSMLAYQLLSHERKKMYWEQLELRCRSLYRPPTAQGATASNRTGQATCTCCSQCHPAQPAWDISLQHRFWAPGRIGNLYSPNPGTGRKTSAWSWFPWPRSNSQNSRCRMGVPQSGDSAYGFCDTDAPQSQNNQNPNPSYEERSYPANFTQNFPRNQSSQQNNNFAQNSNFAQNTNFAQDGFESSGNFDSQTGVWGPPPPYSPQGRSGSRHHLHQDPAAATLLHHHHIDVHRSSMPIHDHANLGSNLAIQNVHTCTRNSSYIPHPIHPNEMPLTHLAPELVHLNPELTRLNPELARLNPNLYPADVTDLVRLQTEIAQLGSDARFSTLRGHLVPYPACQRNLNMSVGNLHRDCRLPDENITIECLHQKTGSKVSDQSTDSSQKHGKENLAFQNDLKHSPMRSSMQDCHRNINQNAESEVYFADVSSCCNFSVKADCCANPNVSALVGTIENHPESTSESETGSFTLTRKQRPQPQSINSKRRARNNQTEKHLKNQEKFLNNSLRLTEQHIQQLNNSMRIDQSPVRSTERSIDLTRMNESLRLSDRSGSDLRMNSRINESIRLSDRSRMNDSPMNDSRLSDRSRINDSQINDSRLNDRSRMNDSQMNDSRISDRSRMNDSQINDSRLNDRSRMNDSQINDSRISDRSRMNDSQMNDSRLSDLRMDLDETRLSCSSVRQPHLNQLRHIPRNSSPLHPRQSSTDSNSSHKNNPDFFVPPPPNHSPLSPNTEESVISDDGEKSDKPEVSKCLAPDSQYDVGRRNEEIKVNHLHCYSDTNTMDSGWQSGSEKHATD